MEMWDGVTNDDPVEFEAAIKKGANINEYSPAFNRQTPLVHAALKGYPKVAKKALELGADINIGEKDGYTAMHAAATSGQYEVMQVLIDFGLNPDDFHRDGFSPLHRACWGSEKRHAKTVEVLLNAGVDPEMVARGGIKTCRSITSNQNTLKLLDSLTGEL